MAICPDKYTTPLHDSCDNTLLLFRHQLHTATPSTTHSFVPDTQMLCSWHVPDKQVHSVVSVLFCSQRSLAISVHTLLPTFECRNECVFLMVDCEFLAVAFLYFLLRFTPVRVFEEEKFGSKNDEQRITAEIGVGSRDDHRESRGGG